MSERTRISRTTFVVTAVIGISLGTIMMLRLGAQAQGAGYVLTDFEIVHPYDDPRVDVPPADDLAAVSFVAHWPESGFPGTADCQLTLTGADGKDVGSMSFNLVSGTDGGASGPIIATVSGKPISATATCADTSDPGEDSSGSGYVVTGPTEIAAPVDPATKETIAGVTDLQFDVKWENAGVSPGMRSCQLVVERTDGTIDAPIDFLMLSGEEPITKRVDGPPDTVSGARITCGPVKG